MAEAPRKIQLSYEAYLALEQETGERHEYLDGEAWAMAGGDCPALLRKGEPVRAPANGAAWAALPTHGLRPEDLCSFDRARDLPRRQRVLWRAPGCGGRAPRRHQPHAAGRGALAPHRELGSSCTTASTTAPGA